MKILILTPHTLRAIICATPAINAVRRQYPDAQITLLTAAIGREICPTGTIIDTHIEQERYRTTTGRARLLSIIRKQKFSIVINFEAESKSSALLTILSGARSTAGRVTNFFGKFYTNPTPLHAESLARSPYSPYLEVIEQLGIRSSDCLPVIYRSERDKRMAREYFDKHGLYKKATLVLAPTACSPLYCWSAENFAIIGRKFLTKYGGKVLITWSGSGLGIAQEVQKLIGERAIVCPKTSIGEFAALLAEAGVVVCHDSSAMHIALSVQVPAVIANTPTGSTPNTTLQIGVPGIRLHYQAQQPASDMQDDDIAAQLATIHPDRVWEAVENIWRCNYY